MFHLSSSALSKRESLPEPLPTFVFCLRKRRPKPALDCTSVTTDQMRFRSRVTSAIHRCIINVLILTAFFALQRHCRTCCGSLPPQTLRAHAFSVFRLVGLRRHPGGTIVPPFTLLYHMGSSPTTPHHPVSSWMIPPPSQCLSGQTPPLWIEVMLRQIWEGRVCLYVCNICVGRCRMSETGI